MPSKRNMTIERSTTPGRQSVAALALTCLLVASTGCTLGGDRWKFASWDVRKAVGLKKDDKPDPQIPTRMVSTWTEAVENRIGAKSRRGFGGRLTFFKSGSEKPVRVDGQLVVYAFDETTREPYQTEPTRRYVFPAESLAVRESDGELGTSYSVWLPWDESGGTERKISLIARFEPKDGPVIAGEQTNHYLAGAPATPAAGSQQMALTPSPEAVTSAAFEQSAAAPVAVAGEQSVLQKTDEDPLLTTSIPLPRKLSPTPGTPLFQGRVAPGQLFTTPHMNSVAQLAPPVSGTTPNIGMGMLPAQTKTPQQQALASQAAWQTPAATGGYLAPRGFQAGPAATAQAAQYQQGQQPPAATMSRQTVPAQHPPALTPSTGY